MICPKCKEELLKSKVKILSINTFPSANDAFWDEHGIFHLHGDMKRQYKCICDNKHNFFYIKSDPCMTANCNFVFESVEFI